jgi:hypothetical protein
MLAKATALTFLKGLAAVVTYIALGVWAIVFAGMFCSLVRPLLPRPHEA